MENVKGTELLKKILAIRTKQLNVEKNGKNDKQDYSYAEIKDIKNAINPELVNQKLVYTGNTVSTENLAVKSIHDGKEKSTPFIRVIVDFTLSDVDSGMSSVHRYVGDGMDFGDKGVYKAYTGAEKYFLTQTFGIATGDDPEKNSISDKIYEKPEENARKPIDEPSPETGTDPKDLTVKIVEMKENKYIPTLWNFTLEENSDRVKYIGVSKSKTPEGIKAGAIVSFYGIKITEKNGKTYYNAERVALEL